MRLTIRPVSPARCSDDGFEKYFVCVMLSASCLVTQHLKAVCYIIRFFIYPAHHFFITLLSFVRLFDTVTRVVNQFRVHSHLLLNFLKRKNFSFDQYWWMAYLLNGVLTCSAACALNCRSCATSGGGKCDSCLPGYTVTNGTCTSEHLSLF